jgi:hypothetical protein
MLNRSCTDVVSITANGNVVYHNRFLLFYSFFQLDGDADLRHIVLAEMKPLLVRVRHPSKRLLQEFLRSLTACDIEAYNSTGGRGHVNTTASACRSTVRWLQRRSSDIRSNTLAAIRVERIDAMLDG